MSSSYTPGVFDTPLTPDEFREPPSRFGLAPFWFWNGDMDETRVREQVRAMKKAHVGGFFIHPRQGLRLPYLSSEFFARVRVAVEEAAQLGMEAWLYDEFPYPSGIAGGMLTAQNPDLRARVLTPHSREVRGGERVRLEMPMGRVVCALAVPVGEEGLEWEKAIDVREHVGIVLTRDELWLWPMGHIPYNEKRFMADEGALVLEWEAPSGNDWKVIVGLEREQRGHKYFDVWFDPLHLEAGTRFLDLTHEKYAQSVGEWFGTTIPGIFTDEIEPPHWSPHLQSAFDWDWSRVAPALWDGSFPGATEIRLQWREKALELFRERWEEPVARWCQEHNLIWCAEKPTYRPSQMALVAQPSTDAGHRRVDLGPETLPLDLRANGRAAMSIAEQNGTEEVRCECWHSLGWGATLQDQKWSLDWMGATGVNRFTPHAFYYSSAGLRKHDAAPSFFEENPYWAHFHLLGDYTARLGLALSRGREVAPVALLYPTKRLWRHDKESETHFGAMMDAMLRGHFGFHLLDAPSLVGIEAKNGVWEVGRARYETLLVPPSDEDDEEMQAVVEAARRGGLRVLDCGDIEGTLAALEEAQRLSVTDESGRELSDVWSLWRHVDGEETQDVLFLANTSGVAVTAHVRIRCEATSWANWSLETGHVAPVAVSWDQGMSRLSVELPAFGSALLLGGRGSSGVVPAVAKRTLVLDVGGEWDIRRDEPNALRLNRWQVAATDAPTDETQWQSIEALPLFHRDKRVPIDVELLARSAGDAIWYRRVVESEVCPSQIGLRIEDGAIGGEWSVWLNGHEVGRDAFTPNFLHGRNQVACDLTPSWRQGENTLLIQVKEGKPYDARGGLRTPLHLFGEFGVGETREGGRLLVAPAIRGEFNDLEGAGLPHFAGTVRYSRRVPAATFAGYDVLALPVPLEDIVQLRLGGGEVGVRAWSPYEWGLPTFGANMSEEIEVELAVTNTLLRFLEGRLWNARTGEKRDV